MALTEPQAGSSLADITTAAEPTAQGDYRIKGQKIFISASEHDGADNVVNLMLAKIKGARRGQGHFAVHRSEQAGWWSGTNHWIPRLSLPAR